MNEEEIQDLMALVDKENYLLESKLEKVEDAFYKEVLLDEKHRVESLKTSLYLMK